MTLKMTFDEVGKIILTFPISSLLIFCGIAVTKVLSFKPF